MMAPRKSSASVAVEEEESHLVGLNFDEPLSWRAGRAVPTGDLLRRLETLSTELREMDQEETDKNSLTKVAKELAGQHLMNHKDRGVRAFTACCLVDVLKICAPDAPFTPTQLKDIFTLFVTFILPALSDPSNAYNAQHVYVLTSLAEVKSIILLTDVSNSESLILHLFTNFFDIISGSSKSSTGEQISKNVEYNMNSILATIIDEAQNLPPEVIDIIVAQFLRAATLGGIKGKQNGADENQATLLVKEYPPAYKMAETICNTCPEKMSRYISQYFNDVIVDASGSSAPVKSDKRDHRKSSPPDEDEEETASGPTEADLRELNKAHRLLRELWRASPAVLQNVIPQLDAELSAENIQLRLLATETLGDIISGVGAAGPPPSRAMDPAAYPPLRLEDDPEPPLTTNILTTPLSPLSFSQTHPAVYHSFLGRKNDKSAIIRSAWTTAISRILMTSAGGVGLSREDELSLVIGLAEKLNDADDRVRIAAIKAVAGFSFQDVMSKLSVTGDLSKPGSILCSLADRARDRKHPVRVEGMTTLAKIWGVAVGEIAAGNETVISMLGAIPGKIFDAFYTNDQDINVLVDHVLFEQLVPLSYPPSKKKGVKHANGGSQTAQAKADVPFDADRIRAERILILIQSLDAKSKKAFFALQARQTKCRDVLEKFLHVCEEYNGGVMDDNDKRIKEKLNLLINWLVSILPDAPRSTADLWKFAKLHDRRSYQLIRFAMTMESEFGTVHKAIKEFSKRINDAPGAPAGLLDTLIPLVYRGSSLVYNRSHLPTILEYSRTDERGLGATAHEVLNEISHGNPQMFKAQVKELCKLLQEQTPTDSKANDLGSVETLKACASYARKYPDEIPHERKFIQTLISFAQFAEPPQAAKYAVSILMAASERKSMHAKDLLNKSISGWEYGTDHYLTKLAAISQLCLLAPEVVDDTAVDEIFDITTQQILLQVRTTAKDDDRAWQDDSDVDEECQAKCWALKILVNQLRPITDPERAKVLAAPVFKLLNSLVFNEGEMPKSQATPKHHKSRLRLMAASLLLKLCTNRLFDGFLGPTAFNNLACVAQDPTAPVRRGFVNKLEKYLIKGRLPNRYYAVVFLVAFEPDAQFRQVTMTWIRSRAKLFHDEKKPVMEATLARLLSLLAHHPDYSPGAEDLKDTAQYILYYVTSVANEENLGMIYKYAERVKQTRDAIKPGDSDNLYVLSDLAQAVIRKWQEKKGWIMQSFPGKLGLPKDIFAPMPSHEAAQEVAQKQYLPEDMDYLLSGLIKIADKKQKRRIDDNAENPSAKKQRSVSTTKLPTRSPAAKKGTKPKAPAKAPKKRKSSETPAREVGSSERRRSGRAGAAKSYADRDDSEDDKEMWNGVKQWEYTDGHIESDDVDAEMVEEADDEVEEESENEAEVVPEEVERESEAESESEAEPTPPPTNGSKSTPNRAAAKAKAPSQSKIKASPRAKPKAQPKAIPETKSQGKGKVKGKGKGKAVVRDVYDMDDSD